MKTLEKVAGQGRAFAMGPFGSNIKTENFVESGVPVIQGRNLSGTRLDEENFVFVTEEKADELSSSLVSSGDIVITHRGTLGQVVMIPRASRYPRYVISQSQMKVTVDEARMSPEFVTYWLQSSLGQAELLAYASQTGVPAIAQPLASLRKMKVVCPPLHEQRAIAGVLGALDDKIESNRKCSDLIWKVLTTEWQSLTADGPIRALREVLGLSYGKSLPTTNRAGGKVPVYGSSGITGWHNEALVNGPAVIVGRKGSIGEVHWSSRSVYPIDTTFYVTTRNEYPLLACYFALKGAGLKSMNSDSAIPGLNRDRALGVEVRLPSCEEALLWNKKCEPLLRKADLLAEETATLVELRNALLPELLTGRMRVELVTDREDAI